MMAGIRLCSIMALQLEHDLDIESISEPQNGQVINSLFMVLLASI
jgi:hypothetical protein